MAQPEQKRSAAALVEWREGGRDKAAAHIPHAGETAVNINRNLQLLYRWFRALANKSK